jgi:hypothetical protein
MQKDTEADTDSEKCFSDQSQFGAFMFAFVGHIHTLTHLSYHGYAGIHCIPSGHLCLHTMCVSSPHHGTSVVQVGHTSFLSPFINSSASFSLLGKLLHLVKHPCKYKKVLPYRSACSSSQH